MVNSSEYLERMASDIEEHRRSVCHVVIGRDETCESFVFDFVEEGLVVEVKSFDCLSASSLTYDVLISLRSAFSDMIDNVFKII